MNIKRRRILHIAISVLVALSQLDNVNNYFSRKNRMSHVLAGSDMEYDDIIEEISDDSYRESADICDDEFIIVRYEDKKSEEVEESDWYRNYDIEDCEKLSERRTEDGQNAVTYSVTLNPDDLYEAGDADESSGSGDANDKGGYEKYPDNKDIWDVIDDINSSDECILAEPVYNYRLCDDEESSAEEIDAEKNANPSAFRQWYLQDQGCDELIEGIAGQENVTGKGGIVAVIDTGVDYMHEDLADNMWVNYAELEGTAGLDDDGNGIIDDIYGTSFDEESTDPMDYNVHGTHVAGIIAMADNNTGGLGLMPDVKVMAVKAAGSDGIFRSVDIARAIRYAGRI